MRHFHVRVEDLQRGGPGRRQEEGVGLRLRLAHPVLDWVGWEEAAWLGIAQNVLREGGLGCACCPIACRPTQSWTKVMGCDSQKSFFVEDPIYVRIGGGKGVRERRVRSLDGL